jgi:rubrerythrin
MAEILNDLKSILSTKTLSKEEIIRALRVSIKAEIDAVHLYDMIAESTDEENIQKVMKDVANEEKVHIGEFLKVIQILDDEEMTHYNKGAKEVEEILELNDEENEEHPYYNFEQMSFELENEINESLEILE